MIINIFVNLAVKDLAKSMAFFEGLGFEFNKQFTDETAASLVLGPNIYAMLLTHDKMKMFIANREIADTSKVVEALLAVSVERKEAVDQLADKAIELGGKEFRKPDDYRFMYSRSIEDLDGHVWEILHMDPDFVQK